MQLLSLYFSFTIFWLLRNLIEEEKDSTSRILLCNLLIQLFVGFGFFLFLCFEIRTLQNMRPLSSISSFFRT